MRFYLLNEVLFISALRIYYAFKARYGVNRHVSPL